MTATVQLFEFLQLQITIAVYVQCKIKLGLTKHHQAFTLKSNTLYFKDI